MQAAEGARTGRGAGANEWLRMSCQKRSAGATSARASAAAQRIGGHARDAWHRRGALLNGAYRQRG